MALPPAESAEALTNLREEAEHSLSGEGLTGHLRDFFRCGRTECPLSLGLWPQERGPGYQHPGDQAQFPPQEGRR